MNTSKIQEAARLHASLTFRFITTFLHGIFNREATRAKLGDKRKTELRRAKVLFAPGTSSRRNGTLVLQREGSQRFGCVSYARLTWRGIYKKKKL